MYCPECGKSDQEPEAYCRNCGEFLPSSSGTASLLNAFLDRARPITQVTVNLGLNLLTIFTCFLLLGFLKGHYDALEERTGTGAPRVIYFVYGFLLAISAWQFLSMIVGARLWSRLRRKRTDGIAGGPDSDQRMHDLAEIRKLPHEPATIETALLSVTEEPTRTLEKR